MARGKGPTRQAQQSRIEDEEASVCPLCIEPLDAHEQDWFPCACGYQVCAFCYQRLRLENNNQCPGCRTEYGTQSTVGPRVDAKAKLSPAKKPGVKPAENGVHSPARPTVPPRAATVLEVSPKKAVRPVEAPKPVPITAPSRTFPERALPSAASSSRARAPVLPLEIPAAPALPTVSSSSQGSPEAKVSSEERQAGGLAGPSKASPWRAQAVVRPARPPPPPSPTKWPELGGVSPTAPPPPPEGVALRLPPEGPEAAAEQQLSPPEVPSQTHSAEPQVPRPGRTYPAELLWSMLLASEPPPPDAHGSALRESIQKAVNSGQLSSSAGAARLIAHLESAAQPSNPVAQQPAQPAAPQPETFAHNGTARLHPSAALGEPAAATGGGSGNHVSASDWLQSGVAAALGLPPAPRPQQPPAQAADLWARPQQQPASNLWAGSRLDADVVPDSLQELWANSTASSSGREQYASQGRYGSYTRRSGDPLEAAAGTARVAAPNGYTASGHIPAPAASHALSQGVSAGLGLGASALHASNAYLQGVRAALEYGLPPGFAGGVGQTATTTWNGHGLSSGLGSSQGQMHEHMLAPALPRAPPGWPLPELPHQSYAPQLNGGGRPVTQSAPMQPPPGWASYSNGLDSRLYRQ